MNIIYILTSLALIISYLLLNKSEKKENLIHSVIISVILFLTYNIFITQVMFFVHLKSTLLNLAIVNIAFSAVFITKEIKTKTIQKYYINKLDIIAVIIILGLAITIVIMNYGTNIAVKHAVTDAATHYFASDDFYRYSTLFSRESSDTIKWLNTPYLMTGAYVNTGIFLKLFKGIIDETFLVKLYFIFDMFIWMLSGLLMYTALSTNFKNKKHQRLALVLTIFYMLAYQLNSLFAGFSYLGVGLDIIIGIIIIMKSEIKTNYKISSLFLLNLGIMFSYYYFAPVLFLAQLWYILATNKKQNIKIFSKQNIFEILIALVIPGLIGVIYFIGYPLMQANNKAFDYVGAIATDGFIYEDLIMNIFPYLLLSEVYIIYIAFKKKNTFIDKLLYLTVIFTLLIYMLMRLEFVSSYYYYKIYYMLFLVLTVSSYEILKIFVDKGKNVTIIVSGVLIIYSFGIFSAMILDKNWFVFDIYLTNGEEIKDDYALIKDKEFYLFEYYNNNINTMQNDDTLFCKTKGNTGRDRWVYSITKNGNNLTNALTNDKITTVEKFMENSKYHYFVLLKNDYGGEYDKVQDEVKRYNLKILIQNSAGMILEKQDLAE
ncbi:MAG: hypothetical protein KHW50_03960 [Clostridium sp.]|jgi:hypothetical protein|nr:hypothetical protein [Clostridium sp.]